MAEKSLVNADGLTPPPPAVVEPEPPAVVAPPVVVAVLACVEALEPESSPHATRPVAPAKNAAATAIRLSDELIVSLLSIYPGVTARRPHWSLRTAPMACLVVPH